jgi:hypothetical protein
MLASEVTAGHPAGRLGRLVLHEVSDSSWGLGEIVVR